MTSSLRESLLEGYGILQFPPLLPLLPASLLAPSLPRSLRSLLTATQGHKSSQAAKTRKHQLSGLELERKVSSVSRMLVCTSQEEQKEDDLISKQEREDISGEAAGRLSASALTRMGQWRSWRRSGST